LSKAPSQTANSGPSVALSFVVFVICLPATLYGAVWTCAQIVPAPVARAFPDVPALRNFFAICWFIVVLAGRPLCVVALVLDAGLVLWRKAPAWPKLLGSAFVVFAVLGTLLVESQARAVRH
jgi:hypothetical protein